MNSANSREQSRIKYESSRPASSYTDRSGKTVNINQNDHNVSRVRNTVTSDRYERRSTIIREYYGPRYDYYYSQPVIYVGGGYSHIFWYSLLDWELHRQALWLYHHQNVVDQQLYNQRMQNAQLRLEVEKLKAQGLRPDPTYVDPKMKGNEDLMYSDEFVKAAYNPVEVSQGSNSNSGVGKTIFIILIMLTIVFLIYILFFHNFKNLK